MGQGTANPFLDGHGTPTGGWYLDTQTGLYIPTIQRMTPDGAALVLGGLAGDGHIRRLNALNPIYARATNGANFTEVGGVKQVFVTIMPDAAADNSKKAILTYGAATEAIASAWLVVTGGQAVEVQQIPLEMNVRCGPFTFNELINWFDIATDVAAKAIVEGVKP